ncbi:hypothetical protein GDO78_005655 [Eleutherodactylus coqui]|uniref:Exocyst complex component Sec8 n=1 Tax=Eleutherodactylus coqui TaxID=57060 RepID=A0A8J6KF18_ELECQ|nr:hypothetical protein GDO78_005655 [Eleutherodactylus coqui]
MLLHCKRDELRKLWIEGIEHKHVLNLLDEIENIKQVPQKLEQCMASKHYLNATDMLVSAVDSLEGPLLQVEGLSDLRLELHSKKMNMHSVLIDELHRHLYIKSTSRVGRWNQDKTRSGSLAKDSPLPLLDVSNLSTPRKFLDNSQFGSPGCSTVKDLSLQDIKEDPDSDPEENSIVFMGVLIKGLAKLKKIPETVKAIKERLEHELKQIVKRSTTQVADNGYQRGETVTQENQPRMHFLAKHNLAKSLLRPIVEKLHKMFCVKKQINSGEAGYACVRGHDNLIGGGSRFVCKPGARNITIIFHPLLKFIQEIEHGIGFGPIKQCPLREFLTMYIKNIFLNQVLAEINKEIEGVTKVSDPLKLLAGADTMKILGVQRPLLQSTVIVEKSIQDLMNLMRDLSAYSDQFLNMVCVKLQEYKDTCSAAFRCIVQSDEKLVISASWAKDDDITRLLKSLPNWLNMTQPKQLRPKREDEEDFIRAAFAKESEVLIGNLGDKLTPQNEIMTDVSDLKALANLHESLEWLAGRLKLAISNLPNVQSKY